jgi:hypothetical protein
VVPRKSHRLHDRFGARHVERDLVESGNLAKPGNVLGDHRMIGSERRTQHTGARFGRFDACLVEVISEDIDAVGSGQIVEDVTVEIGHGHARRRLQERAGATQMFANQAVILKWHPVGFGELQVGYMRQGLRHHLPPLRVSFAIEFGETEEAFLPLRGYGLWGAIRAKEVVDVELVERDETRHRTRQFGMTRQRAMFGPRQPQPRLHFGKDSRSGSNRSARRGENRNRRIHDINR